MNRYVFYRVSRERADVLRAYPDLDDEQDGAGYLAWCWAFGQHELDIPGRFMPPGGEGARVAPPPAAATPGDSRPPSARSARRARTTPTARALPAAPWSADGRRAGQSSWRCG